jgi:hypothetical protein
MLLSWGAPDEPQAEKCSICEAPFGEVGEPDFLIPLRLWRSDGWAVALCDDCVARWIEVH